MGWAGGTYIMRGIIDAIQPRVKDEALRVEIYRDIVDVLRGDDWDTMSECRGDDPAYDVVYREHYPDDEDDWDDEDGDDDFDEEDEDE